MLDLSCLENVKHRAGKFHAACPACREEGRDRAGDNLAVFDSGGYRCAAINTDEHRRRIWELAGERTDSHAPPRTLIARRPVPAKPPPPSKPRLPPLRTLTVAEMAAIAAHRRWHSFAGLQLLSDRGLLWFGRVWDDGAEHDAWIITDSARRNAQARRLDGKPWQCGKAKTLPGAHAAFPVGLEESRPFPHIMLCEGSADFAAALHVAWWNGYAADVAPIGILGAGNHIPAEAAPYFKGKAVTIMQHADAGDMVGQKAAQGWADFARGAGALAIHFAGFHHVTDIDGKPCKDLADLAQTLRLPEPEEMENAAA